MALSEGFFNKREKNQSVLIFNSLHYPMSFQKARAKLINVALILTLTCLLLASACTAQSTADSSPVLNPDASPENFGFVKVAQGFNQPLGVVHAGDASKRLFVLERGGLIHVLTQAGERLTTPFLDVSGIITDARGEQGLLGLAFHPNYETNGRFFINYTIIQPNASVRDSFPFQTVIAEYRVSTDANIADASSSKTLLIVDQPAWNHNGGHLAFGPNDGYLYIASGDGGDGGDPRQNGQALYTGLGKILRIDVDGDSLIPESNPWASSPDAEKSIWSYGLRNPWRFSFDRATGDMYIGDVGQNKLEEISFQPDGVAGLNFGWRTMEGRSCFNPATNCDTSGLTLPILEYSHSGEDGVSVTGGYVYRGEKLTDLQGRYFYGDFASGRIWSATRNGDSWTTVVFADTDYNISSFGEDEAGELYVADYKGAIYRFGE